MSGGIRVLPQVLVVAGRVFGQIPNVSEAGKCGGVSKPLHVLMLCLLGTRSRFESALCVETWKMFSPIFVRVVVITTGDLRT